MSRLSSSFAPSSSLSPALMRHPLSSPTSRPPANDIANSWILEFVLRQPIPNRLAHEIFLSLPFTSSFHPHLRKTLLLHRLASEIHSGSLSERTLHALELIEEHDRIRGAAPSNRLKAAYCSAAVECTAAARRRGAEEFVDAVKRIWKARIADIERSEAAVGLVSEKLIEWAKIMERCPLSGEGGEELFDRDIEGGMGLIRDYLNEAMEEMGPSFLEIAAAEINDISMDSTGSACKVGKVKDADQCVGKLEVKGKSLEDDGIGEKCEDLGDSCMWGLEDDGVLERSRFLKDVSTKDLVGDGIKEKSRGLGDASTDGELCYGAEGLRVDPVAEVDVQGCVNLGGHDMSDPGGRLIHQLDPSAVSKVKEALKNSRLDLQMMVEDPLPDAEITAAAVLISISSGNVCFNGPAKHSSRSNGVLPNSVIELAADLPAGLGTCTDALVKEKSNLVPLPDIVYRGPSDSKHLEENGTVEECNRDAGPSKHKDISVQHALFERNPTGYASELSDDSLQSRHLPFVKSADQSPNLNTRRISLPRLDDRRLVRRRAIKRWTLLEENTLKDAVAKYGKGNWKLILSLNAEIFKGRTEDALNLCGMAGGSCISISKVSPTQRPHHPVRPIPSQLWCKNFGTKDY